MKFGVGVYPAGSATDVVLLAREAERLGFDSVSIGDSHLIWRELYTLLGAIAVRTRHIQIGPGVTHPVVRHPSLTASAIVTLAQLAPHRVRLGIGTGDSGAENMGVKRSTLAELREALAFIRALFAGDVATHLEKTMGLAATVVEPIPIYVAAASEATLRLCGELADGALMAGPLDEVPAAMAAIREGEVTAGREDGSVAKVIWTTACIDRDPKIARDAVRPVVARKALVSLGRAARFGTIADEDREPLQRLAQEYDFRQHMGPAHSHLVMDRWIDRFALAGTPANVLEHCRTLMAQGADELSIVFHGPDQLAQMRAFAKTVLPSLRT